MGRSFATDASATSAVAVVVEVRRRVFGIDRQRPVVAVHEMLHQRRGLHDRGHLGVVGHLDRAEVHEPVDVVAAARRPRDHHASVGVAAQHHRPLDRVEQRAHGAGVGLEPGERQLGRQVGDPLLVEQAANRFPAPRAVERSVHEHHRRHGGDAIPGR